MHCRKKDVYKRQVEQGVCDLGIVGKDTILEKGGSFYEVLDLGFGRCRMAVAGFPSGRELLDMRGDFKVCLLYTSRRYPADSPWPRAV